MIVIILFSFMLTTCSRNTRGESSQYSWQKYNSVVSTSIYSYNRNYALSCFSNTIWLFDGSSWKEQWNIEGVDIGDVFVLNEREAWLTGYEYQPTEDKCGSAIYCYDGSSWEEIFCVDNYLLDVIIGIDSEHLWASGNRSYGMCKGLILFNDGNGWEEQYDLADNVVVSDMTCTNANHVWAVGTCVDSGYGYIDPKGPGYIYFFDGSSWRTQYKVEKEDNETIIELLGIDALDDEHVWAVGRKVKGGIYTNIIYFYDGSNWSMQYEEVGDKGLSRVCAVDRSHVWAVGGSDIFFFDGLKWRRQYDTSKGASVGNELVFTDISANDCGNIWVSSSIGIFLGKKLAD